MIPNLSIRGTELSPGLFCAPLAEVTHSAFRRLIAEFGGCGAQFTEMLSGRHILKEDLAASPYTKRRPVEKKVFYQLMLRPDDPVEQIVERLASANPDGIDINLACYAPVIRNLDACARLFDNMEALAKVLGAARKSWNGPLTAKIRLGHSTIGAEDRFIERLRVIENAGIDAITLHTRFFEDKFKRRSRHELFAWATSLTKLPVIANGDITGAHQLREHAELFKTVSGFMLGRMAIARPWIFASWSQPVEFDYAEVWNRLHDYIAEDFQPNIALRRLRLFTKYYARNFHFGHTFNMAIHNAPDMATARDRAAQFFAVPQPVFAEPNLQGL